LATVARFTHTALQFSTLSSDDDFMSRRDDSRHASVCFTNRRASAGRLIQLVEAPGKVRLEVFDILQPDMESQGRTAR
jgi:hypothetical protein